MHSLLYVSMLLTASASYLPIQRRGPPTPDPCMEEVQENEAVFDDAVTADGTAGIGAEFESPVFYFTNPDCSLDDTNAAKRKVIAKRTGDNWKLTADTGFGQGMVDAEYILDGANIKVGTDDGANTGKAIADDLIAWKPWNADKPEVDIEDNKCNPWTISGPKKDTDPATLEFSPQVTVPMPLEALYSLMKEQLEDPDDRNILDGINIKYEDLLVVVDKDYFQSKPNNMDGSKVTDDVFGFCSLVLGYAKAATNPLGSETSPKVFETFMPRTEFNTIFSTQVKSKIPGDLYDLFNTLACYKRDDNKDVVLDTDFCKGTAAKPVPGTKFGGLSFKNTKTSANVKDWITGIGKGDPSPDLLTTFDQSIDSSIGGLGTQQEKMFNSQRSVPLFEFRDLLNIQVSGFEQFMKDVDAAVQKLHQDFANAPKQMRLKRDAPASCTLTAAASPTTTTTSVGGDGGSPTVPTVAPVDPPSQPSCVPNPTDHVKDAHEDEMQKVAKFFCDKYASSTNAQAPINIAQTVMAGQRSEGRGSVDIAFDYPTNEGNQDDVYDITLTSVPNCTPAGGAFNLATPVANNQCADILHNAWKTCYYNQGRGGDITAGCLVYSIHTKY